MTSSLRTAIRPFIRVRIFIIILMDDGSGTIPSEEVSWSIAHLVINENFQKLREICESAASASNLPDSSNMKKIGDYWAMAIDSQRCDQLGITPIQPYIHLIDSAKSQEKTN